MGRKMYTYLKNRKNTVTSTVQWSVETLYETIRFLL